MHHITEDTPPDMLAGAMDLVVRLPDGRDVSMAVERSTPMMDLLVHLTTANKLRPSDHVLQALDMSRDRTLPYKPNTPIGALDTQRVRVIPKGPGKGLAPKVPTGQQPFESTFRLQVHLPRNQFCVIRVGKYVFLEDIMKKVCEEKNLDSKKYEFRHPANIDKVLDPKRTLNDYEITEITVVHKGSGHLSQALSTTDIMALQREEERRKLQSKTGGGVLNLIFKRGRNSMGSGSISSDTRSISPTQSDDSRSVTPPAIQNQAPIIKSTSKDSLAAAAARPKPPLRKRRPAPKPPSVPPSPENQHQSAPAPLQDVPKNLQAVEKCPQEETTLTICHSRNSSDSSGYHEASILSDNCNTTLPRRPKSTVIDSTSNLSDAICTESRQDFRKSTGNLSNMTQSKSTSTMSLNIAGRKKKPPPPPPSLSSANSAASINSSISTPPTSEIISEVVASKSNAISTNNICLVDHKLQSDHQSPGLTKVLVESTPKPKPRTFKSPVPVPTPRKLVKTASVSTVSSREPSICDFSLVSSVEDELDLSIVSTSDLPQKISVTSALNYEVKETTPSAINVKINDISCNPSNEELFQRQESLISISDSFASEKESACPSESSKSPAFVEGIRKDSKFDTAGRTRGFQIGSSLLSMSSSENMTRNFSSSTLNSSSSRDVEIDTTTDEHFNSIQIENIELFENPKKRTKKTKTQFHKSHHLAEINDLRQNKTYHELLANSPSNSSLDLHNHDSSVLSLRSFTSLPGFMASDVHMKKWENLESLNNNSLNKEDTKGHHWVLGDPSDADSIGPASPTDNSSLPRTSDTSLHAESLTSNRSSESASIHSNSSPTPNVGSPKKTSVSSLINSRDEVINREIKVVAEPVLQTVEKQESCGNKNESSKRVVPPAPKRSSLTTLSSREDSVSTETAVQETVRPEEKEVIKEVKTVIHKEVVEVPKIEEKLPEETHNELESDWQYTLPSPPTAFRDSSPTNFTDVTNYDTVTFNGLTSESIVTSPALFEKLESISNKRLATDEETISNVSRKTEDNFENNQSTEKTEENLVKLATHVKKPEEEVLTSKYLSLETLEKRKSLVLERELASLKMMQSESTVSSSNNEIKSQRDSLRNEIEEVIQNKSRSSNLSRQNSQSREKLLLSATDSTLPNFKITTYDQPKSKINIFEDDSIRSSNIELRTTNKHHSSMEESNSNLMRKRNSLTSVSTENIYFTKRNSADDFLFKKPSEVPHRYIKKTIVNDENRNNQDSKTSTTDSISRSESFSAQKNAWSRANPVKRSKSHISLDKYKDDTVGNTEDGLHKSNSLYNVSGLQSLEVMRMILPKLGNTPPSSPSEDKKKNPLEEKIQVQPQTSYIPPKPEIPREPSTPKKYQYSGPPAINFATWGERPKTQISIKEDTDYKFSNIKSKFNNHSVSKQENVSSYNAVNIKVTSNDSRDQVDSGKINIKINSNDDVKTISQPSGNVVIKIGSNNNSGEIKNGEEKIRFNNPYTRFLNQTTAVGYRKPLGNINGVDRPRPHSIAFDASCPDLSRVPIVTGVELKKTYKESNNNKSITQILHDPPFHQNGNNTQDDDVSSPTKSHTLGNQYRHSSVYLSSENINKIDNKNGQSKGLSIAPLRNVSRGNSFVTRNNSTGLFNSGPVIKGFRESDIQKITSKSLDAPFSQSTLKRTDYSVKKPVSVPVEKSIFETVTLRKTSNFNRYSMPSMPIDNQHNSNTPTRNSVSTASVVENKSNGFHSNNRNSSQFVSTNNPPPPPPAPKMPKGMTAQKKPLQRQLRVEDPRDQLLESIRSFGGKSGLRAIK